MNHDTTHCLDYCERCPASCYRAALTEDLKHRPDLSGLYFSWASLKGTDASPKWLKKRNKI